MFSQASDLDLKLQIWCILLSCIADHLEEIEVLETIMNSKFINVIVNVATESYVRATNIDNEELQLYVLNFFQGLLLSNYAR